MGRSLTVAAAQPACQARDPASNVATHAAAVRAARARVVVFPELSLTGYELDADAVDCDDPVLTPLVAACGDAGTLALAGAPVEEPEGRFIAVLAVDGAGARVAYHKTWLGGREPEHFVAGSGPAVLEIDGWRVGLGICKDTGAARHTAGTAALDVDVYVAGLVHHADELPEQEARATVIARACDAFVVFAGFAGPTGEGFDRTAGASAIWAPSGLSISRAGPAPGAIVRAVLS
ncbi:carbon-nitrogen hydrolase family protein [Actinomycetospora cinnamomea]|uniref:carbon-nitrogen hydrolase family protein n=1 Tax=Actinomycetospora cinnamomea TaxID=663609 RepID=UPI000E321503|nr:carbon-nitrogen hydrolase family protein [Actinomycetospora cinnamomea]